MPTHHRKKKNKLSKKIGGGGEKKSALYKIVIGREFIKTRKNPNLKITEPYLT